MTAAVTAMLILAACGGGPAATPPASLAPGQTLAAQRTPTPAAPAVGEAITGDQIGAAFTALEALDSWTFEANYWVKSLGTGRETSVSGTHRQRPEAAIDATHMSAGSVFRFIWIGEDIWADLAGGTFFHYDAADSEGLLAQYEPFYLEALIEAVNVSRLDFDPGAAETLNGISTTHYTLSDEDREYAAQAFDIDPALWAGDVWLANDSGHLVALAWGPQSVENAQAIQGFRYDVTSVNCSCPVEPPD